MTFNEFGDLAAGSISHFLGLVKLGKIQIHFKLNGSFAMQKTFPEGVTKQPRPARLPNPFREGSLGVNEKTT
jgi:hypothetical protein